MTKNKSAKRARAAALQLFQFASSGSCNKLQALLHDHRSLNLELYNPQGYTALHQAALAGNVQVVKILLSYGASARAEDFAGNTPAHLAAARGQIAVLAELQKAPSAPDLDRRNAHGVSIRQQMQEAMESKVKAAKKRKRTTSRAETPSASEGSDESWACRLKAQAAEDDPEHATAEWNGYENGAPATSGAAQMDEETYARRMWEAMSARRRATAGPTPAAAAAWAAADSAQAARKHAAESAAKASRRILDDEQAKDRAWRQAVLQGDPTARRAMYEARWHVFNASAGPVSYHTVPWLVESRDDARAVILCGTAGPSDERKRVRVELMRWHPDKFAGRFGARLAAADKERIMARVNGISQMLNGLMGVAA